jgi:hypothetical protein
MSAILPKLSHVQRQGQYHYFRYPGTRRVRLQGVPNSAEYLVQYERLLAAAEQRKPAPTTSNRPARVAFLSGSVGWVAAQYLASNEFRSKAPGTQYAYQRTLHLLREADTNIARGLLRDMNCDHVAHHCHEIEKRHGRACDGAVQRRQPSSC